LLRFTLRGSSNVRLIRELLGDGVALTNSAAGVSVGIEVLRGDVGEDGGCGEAGVMERLAEQGSCSSRHAMVLVELLGTPSPSIACTRE
jgi:hypothetical protein